MPLPHTLSRAVEYAIYTYDLPAEGRTHSRWNRHDTFTDLDNACRSARHLMKTRLYSKVEIKKKSFDFSQQKKTDITLKTYELSRFSFWRWPFPQGLFFWTGLALGGLWVAIQTFGASL
ncbi:MAG: hypothetical protein J0L77_01830 [Alphaproteobacteria bacterium]|nr:hypothetical protein [Alphaproteobacteria bacterium]